METTPDPIPPASAPFTPDQVSAIPPELLKQLNLAPPPAAPTKDQLEPDLAGIPPDVLAKVRALGGLPASGEEPGGFSWAGLVYGPVYYWAMKDWPFVALSAVASLSLYGIPLLIPLAFYAHKRAWYRKSWESEGEFWKVQKKWDRSAITGGLATALILYLVSKYLFSSLASTFGTNDPNAIFQQVQSQYQDQ